MKKLIALVDASQYATSVCDHAAWAAERASAETTILHVLGRREGDGGDLSGSIGLGARTELLEELAALDAKKAKLAKERGRAILTDAKARMEEAGAPVVATNLRHGDLLETLADFEKDADLIVVGKRGEAADFAKGHLGSNFERLVRSLQRPVLVANRAYKPIERVLIAFDGGASAMTAVDYIARSKIFAGLDCRLVTVGRDDASTQKKLTDAEDLLRAGGFSPVSAIAAGEPEAVITAAIEEQGADMLVMGAYGHSRIRSLIIGSTTTAMIRSCRVPVMLYR